LIARGYAITRRVIEDQRSTNPVLALGSVI
jgi:hypothetical protein